MGDTSRRTLATLVAALLLSLAASAAADGEGKKLGGTSTAGDAPTAGGAPPPASGTGPIFSPPEAPKPALPEWKLKQMRTVAYQEGQKLVDKGLFKEALQKFREANELRSEPRLLLWMGFCKEQLGELLASRTLYTQAKEDAQSAKLKQEEQDAEAALGGLTQKIPHIVIHLPKGPKAEVYLDSSRVTLTNEQVDVEPGKHTVSVAWPDRPPYKTEVEAKAGETKVIEVVLTQPPPPPEPPPPVPPPPRGCECQVDSAAAPSGGAAALSALGLVAALMARRRRRT